MPLRHQQRRLGFGAFSKRLRGREDANVDDAGGSTSPTSTSSFQPCTPRQGPSTFTAQEGNGADTFPSPPSPPIASPPAPTRTATLSDIIEGRTCRPIALLDLRTFLAQRKEQQEEEQQQNQGGRTRSGSAAGGGSGGAFDGAAFQLADLTADDNNVAQVPSTPSSLAPGGKDAGRSSITATTATTAMDTQGADAVSAAPTIASAPPQCQAAGELNALNFVVAYDRYTRSWREEQEAAAAARDSSRSSSSASQLLQSRFEAIVETYLGEIPGRPRSPHHRRTHRMDWLIDLGLLNEDAIAEAISRAGTDSTTGDPQILLPLVTSAFTYLDTHVMPVFLASASQNLSTNTARGRLAVGIVCTTLAVLFSVLLCIEPSPLTGTHITRWYRVLTLPLWTAGIGYIIAAFTKVCVWLSLRGNRERTRALDGSDAAAAAATRTPRTSAGDVEKAARAAVDGDEADDRDQGNIANVDNSNWLMAPEVWRLLTTVMPFLRTKSWNGGGAQRRDTVNPSASGNIANSESTTGGEKTGVSGVPPPTTPAPAPLAEPRLPRASSSATASGFASNATAPQVKIKSISVPGTSVEFGLRTVALDGGAGGSAGGGASPAAAPPSRRAWTAIQRWTGFAVGTERIRDERIRKVHQRAALKALVLDGVLSVIATIVVVAIP